MKLAVLATGALMAVTGAGVAAAADAPNVVGKTYGDASSALSDAGFTPKVATTVGDKTDRSACMVTSANPAPFVGGTDA